MLEAETAPYKGRSLLLRHASNEMQYTESRLMYLLFDIGATKMRFAISRDLKKIDRVEILPTLKNFKKAMALAGDVAGALRRGERIKGAAGGIAGTLDSPKSKLLTSPNIPSWRGKSLKAELQKICKAPVSIENDAALGGLGEAAFGAGKGKRIVAYYAVGTGIGGARIVDRAIDHNAIGFEPGHQIIFVSQTGAVTLEDLVSGTAVKKRYGTEPIHLKSKRTFSELAEFLGIGLANAITHWSPEIVIVGGSMIVGKNTLSLKEVGKTVRRLLPVYRRLPSIVRASLGDLAGVYGAMAHLRSQRSSA